MISNCCSARIIEDSDICSSCKEHCEAVETETETLSEKEQPCVSGKRYGMAYFHEDVKIFIAKCLDFKPKKAGHEYTQYGIDLMKDKIKLEAGKELSK